MTSTERRKFNKAIKPYLYILDSVRCSRTYPKEATNQEWVSLIDIHYNYVRKNKGSRECEGCKKHFTVCDQINNLRND